MRIVGGQYKGRHIITPKGIRPTAEKVREAIFDTLGDKIEGARVLDLFAGSGALGIEAISRGSSHVIFCEKIESTFQVINKNISKLKIPKDSYKLLKKDAKKAIEMFAIEGLHFDIIFFDPPYFEDMYEGHLLLLSSFHLLEPDGIVVVERSKRVVLSPCYGKLHMMKERRYGDTFVNYFLWIDTHIGGKNFEMCDISRLV